MVGWDQPLTAQQMDTAQQQDPTLSVVCEHLQANPNSAPTSSNWKRFPLHHYKQLWSQLALSDSVLYHIVKSPTMVEKKWLCYSIVLHMRKRAIIKIFQVIKKDTLPEFSRLTPRSDIWGLVWEAMPLWFVFLSS